MERKFQMTAEGIVVYILMPVTPSEQEKLECKGLERTITNIAKDLHVDWAVETTGVTISKTFGPLIGNAQVREVDVAANTFMSAVRQLDIPKKHPEEEEDCPVEDESDVVITFDADNNGTRVIKALREHMGLTVHAAQMRTMRGRIVCKHKDADLIMDNLEVAGARNVRIDEQLTDELNFCNNMLAEWDETDERAQTTGAIIMCGKRGHDLELPCGRICEDTLKKMFIAYVESM
jgi:ribosomal protein L7/L12